MPLIDAGANLNTSSPSGDTPLYSAALDMRLMSGCFSVPGQTRLQSVQVRPAISKFRWKRLRNAEGWRWNGNRSGSQR